MPEIDLLEISVHVKICIAGKRSKELWDEHKHVLPRGKNFSLHFFQIDTSRLDQAAIEIDAHRKDIFFYFVDQSELTDEFVLFMRSIQEPGQVGLLFVCGENPHLPVLDELANFVLTCPIQYEQFSYAVSLIGVMNDIIEGVGITPVSVADVRSVLFRIGKASLLTAMAPVNEDICQILYPKIDAFPLTTEKAWAAIAHVSLGKSSSGESKRAREVLKMANFLCNSNASIINSWEFNMTEIDRASLFICLKGTHSHRKGLRPPWEDAWIDAAQEIPAFLRNRKRIC
jgi:hypothetical protein